MIIIGYGAMGQALAHGWSDSEDISIVHKTKQSTEFIDVIGIDSIAPSSDQTYVLAIKPKDISKTLEQLKPKLHKNNWVISVAAGLPIQCIQEPLQHAKVLRAMPNLAAANKNSLTALFNPHLSSEEKEWVTSLWQRTGEVQWLENESDFHAFTSMVGSGPAFFLMFAEAFRSSAIRLGISENNALMWTKKALIASSNLNHSDFSASIDAIKSKGGTTEAGCNTWDSGIQTQQVFAMIQAAMNKSKSLTQGFNYDHDNNDQ